REVELLVETRIFILVDDEFALLRGKAVGGFAHGEGILATASGRLERDFAGAETADRLLVGTKQRRLRLLVEQERAAGQDRDFLAGRFHERVDKLEILLSRLETETLQGQRAKVYRFAGSIHRLIGRQMRDVDRSSQRQLFTNLLFSAAILPSDDF